MRAVYLFLVLIFLSTPFVSLGQSLTMVRVFFNGNQAQAQYFAVPSLASVDQPFTVDLSGLPRGIHTLYVEVQDNNGRWSLYDHDNIQVFGGMQMATLNACEYFFNTDPGFGEGIQIPLNASNVNQSFDLDLAGLPNGVHVAYLRVRDAANQWSLYAQRVFQVVGSMQSELVDAEYFFNNDPGIGNGQPLALSGLDFNGNLELSVAGLPNGVHTLYLRVKDARGIWSLYGQHNILVTNPQPGTVLVYAEYYIDADPGLGNANPLIVPQSSVIDGNFSITLPPNLTGTHSICVRVQDINGQWSNTECETISICNAQVPQIAIAGQNCQSTPYVLTASGGYDSYTWSNGLSGQSISITETGVYTVDVVSNGCAASSSIDAQFDFLPPVVFNAQGGICAGDVQTLSIENVYESVVWQDGQTSTAITVSESGIYTVTVANGACSSDFSTEVNFIVPDAIAILSSGSSCAGELVTLSLGGNYSNISWSNGSFATSTVVSQSGTYSVTALEQGCPAQGSVEVYFNAPPVVEIVQDGGLCEGDEVLLIVAVGYDAYEWSAGSLNEQQIVTTSGVYEVTVSEGDCSVSQSIDVQLIQVDAPLITQNTNVLACDISGASSYQWYLNGVAIAGASAQFYAATQSGFYTVEVETGGCTASSSIYSFTHTLADEQSSQFVQMYPNPCDDYLVCSLPNSAIQSLEVLDITGRIVLRLQPSSSSFMLDTASWSSGLYTIWMINSEGVVHSARVEKMRR